VFLGPKQGPDAMRLLDVAAAMKSLDLVVTCGSPDRM